MKNYESPKSDSDNATNTNELDVSGITDAAKILIERMKIKPEEFTPGNKFGHIWAACWQRVNPAPHTGAPPPVPLRDAEVLLAAYDKYITEPEFTKHVLGELGLGDVLVVGSQQNFGISQRHWGRGTRMRRGVHSLPTCCPDVAELVAGGELLGLNLHAFDQDLGGVGYTAHVQFVRIGRVVGIAFG